ncbi:NfeD family protein [Mariniluteicoccus flavus]
MEWLGDNLWAAWLCLALALGATEMLAVDLTLLMLAIGALAGGVTAVFLPGLILAQVVVAVAVALISMFVLRPPLLERVRNAKGYRSSVEQLVGSEGRALRAITAGKTGEVMINGDTWTARAWEPDLELREGEPVEVVEIDGVTAVVRPLP